MYIFGVGSLFILFLVDTRPLPVSNYHERLRSSFNLDLGRFIVSITSHGSKIVNKFHLSCYLSYVRFQFDAAQNLEYRKYTVPYVVTISLSPSIPSSCPSLIYSTLHTSHVVLLNNDLHRCQTAIGSGAAGAWAMSSATGASVTGA
jgi:hypothetical protein